MSVNDYREDYIEKKKKKKRTPCFFEDLYFSRYFLSLSFPFFLFLFLSSNYKQLRIKHHPIIDWQIYRSIIRAPILYILEFCFEFKKKKRRTRLVKKKRKHFSRQNKEFFFFFQRIFNTGNHWDWKYRYGYRRTIFSWFGKSFYLIDRSDQRGDIGE